MKQKEDKREQILEAARKVFSRYGYNKTTLDDIGEVVGMKKNSLYHYFENKEDLFKTIIDLEANYYFEKVQEIIYEKETAAEKILALIVDGRKIGFDRMNVYKGTIAAKMEIIGVIENYHKGFIDKQINIMKEILTDGIKKKELIKHNAGDLAQDIVEMNISIEQREYQKSKAQFLTEINHDVIDKRIENLLSLILKGLANNK